MSERSEESIGLCLSEDKSRLTLSDETGEAKTNKSISVESLSLTKISAANTGIFTSEHQPVFITVPYDEDQERPTKMLENPPNFLSVSHHNTSTSGVTPSATATTLEGTLDDIPDFQEMLPLTSVVVTKKDQDVDESVTPESSPAKDSNYNQSLSPPSGLLLNTKEKLLTSEARFMQEVKRQNTTKPTSSIKSFASNTAPKTSTSGITVVEVKPPRKPDGRVTGSDVSRQTNPEHSIGSIKSDTMGDFSASVSNSSFSTSSRPSDMTVFKTFNPDWPVREKPFLLHMPNLEDTENNSTSHGHRRPRKVLGNMNTSSNNQKTKSTKNWKALESKSRSVDTRTPTPSNNSDSSLSYEAASKKRRKKQVVNYMNENGIKQIVKEEMTAVVSMQNEIWHKILDSFVDKALKGNENHVQSEAPRVKPSQSGMVMLQLPKDEPEPYTFYKPLKIPIFKSGDEATRQGPMFLQLPTEEDEIDEKVAPLSIKIEQKTSSEEVVAPVPAASHLDVSVQTSNSVAQTPECVEVGVQPDLEIEITQPSKQPSKHETNPVHGSENLPIKQNLMKPLSENLEYQKTVNKQEIPLKVMEECKMLLERIQNSANELKAIRKDNTVSRKATAETPEEQSFVPSKEEKQSYIKSKHEIFLEKFFDEEPSKKKGKANRFIDIVDLPQSTTNSGHFDLLRRTSLTRKPESEFLHITDISDPRKTHSVDKRLKVERGHGARASKKELQHKKKGKDKKPDKIDGGLRTKDVFAPKREIPRSLELNVESPRSRKSSAVDEPASPSAHSKRSDDDLIPEAPPSPGEVADYKSQSMSSIGKYLSQKDDEEISVSDKTIENEEPMSEEPMFEEGDTLSSQPCKSPDFILEARNHSTPQKEIPERHTAPASEVESRVSSESYQPKPIDPTQFSRYIEDNLSKIKQAYSESQQKEVDRTKKINMLLQNRGTVQSAAKSTSNVTRPTPIRPSPRLKSETVTLIKAPKFIMSRDPPSQMNPC
ncbi:uncharacterized protein LOC134821662 [Bolinopsis microptera]|uniref:uncharacterized protein LOC134821662 n=1 Tax=Bolinopsis microptera TaxID=2820187 RepID=UPI003079B347